MTVQEIHDEALVARRVARVRRSLHKVFTFTAFGLGLSSHLYPNFIHFIVCYGVVVVFLLGMYSVGESGRLHFADYEGSMLYEGFLFQCLAIPVIDSKRAKMYGSLGRMNLSYIRSDLEDRAHKIGLLVSDWTAEVNDQARNQMEAEIGELMAEFEHKLRKVEEVCSYKCQKL